MSDGHLDRTNANKKRYTRINKKSFGKQLLNNLYNMSELTFTN